jgi:hypothetical protein
MMATLVEQLGNKVAGQLIKADDWNALVAAVQGIDIALNARVDTVEAGLTAANTKIDGVTTQLTQLATDFAALKATIEPLLREYLRVTLETTKVDYAVGELAELTARVSDLQGNPLDLAVEANRPWIDFVTSWGQLKPVSGFESIGGAGDRTISVRANAQGIARVRLHAESAEGVADDVDEEVAASLTTVLENNKSIAATILESNTPVEAMPAFRTLSLEYDRTDTAGVRSFVDGYYLKHTAQVLDKRVTPTFRHSWRDYHTTVLAFAKRDSDPRTPDQSRGVASIQVTFRDWIGPWITLDYLTETGPLVQSFRNRFSSRVTTNFRDSVQNFKIEVNDAVRDQGLVGKQRSYQVMRDALDELTVPQPPSFFGTLTKSMQDAINVQQVMDAAQTAAIGAPAQAIALEAFAESAVRADTEVADVKESVAALEQQVGEVQVIGSNVASLQQSVSTLGGKVDAAIGTGSDLQNVRSELDSVKQQVQHFQALDVTDVTAKMGQIVGIENRLSNLERVG